MVKDSTVGAQHCCAPSRQSLTAYPSQPVSPLAPIFEGSEAEGFAFPFASARRTFFPIVFLRVLLPLEVGGERFAGAYVYG